MNKLVAMFLAAGTVVSAGVAYEFYVLKPGLTQADAVDAGIVPLSVPARLSCNFQVHPDCQALPDGGVLPKYLRAQVRARRISLDGGLNGSKIAFDIPDRADGGFCARPVGTATEACEVLEHSTCSVPAVCGQNRPVPEVQQCACRRPDAGNCFTSNLPDGGQPFLAPLGVTIAAGRWSGPGCVRKFCGPILLGENEDWPSVCPRQ